MLAELAGEAFGDLAEVLRLVHRFVVVVVLVAGYEKIFVGDDIDGAHAVGRELCGRGLRGTDPNVPGPRSEQVLNLSVT